MDKIRKAKNPKTKNENPEEVSLKTYRSKRYTKKITIQQQQLKNKIIEKFMILGKQEVGEQDLKWILLNLNYNYKQIKEMMQMLIQGKTKQQKKQMLFRAKNVYLICQKFPTSSKWKKDCFNNLSSNNKSITLQDVQKFWKSSRLNQKDVGQASALDPVKALQSYIGDKQIGIKYEQFENILKQINPFS